MLHAIACIIITQMYLESAGGFYRANKFTNKIKRVGARAVIVRLESHQYRSGAVRHGAEHDRVRRHLAPIR